MKNKIFMFIMFTFVIMFVPTYRADAKVTDKGYTLYINGVKATDNFILRDYTATFTIRDSKGNHINFRDVDTYIGNKARYFTFISYDLVANALDRVENLRLITESGKRLNFSFHVKLCIDFSAVELYNKDTNTNIPEILLRKHGYNDDIILSNTMHSVSPSYENYGVYKLCNNYDGWPFNLEFKLYEDSKCTKEVSNVADYVWAKKKKNGYWYFTEREGIYSKGTPCRFFIRFRMYDSVVGKNSTPFIIADDDVEYYEELLRIMEKIRKS